MAWLRSLAILLLAWTCNMPLHAGNFFDPASARPGDTVTLNGTARPRTFMNGYLQCSGCAATFLGTANVDERGQYSLRFTVPTGTKVGEAWVSIGCDNCGNGWQVVSGLQIAAAAAAATPGPPAAPPRSEPKGSCVLGSGGSCSPNMTRQSCASLAVARGASTWRFSEGCSCPSRNGRAACG